MPSDQSILVLGATGHQGGAAARHLLEDGWKVRALLRDLNKEAAQALAEQGAELVTGDLRDRDAVDHAVEGCYGVFSVQTPRDGVDAEVEEGRNVIEAAKAAGVRHFVYDSVIGAEQESDLPWVRGKRILEQSLRESGLPATIWRPTTFMENLVDHQREGILGGKVVLSQPADESHQWIAVDDIGRFVALAFREPDTWIGQATTIAGDECTGAELAAALSRALGIEVRYEQAAPSGGGWASSPRPQQADIAALRRELPNLLSVEEWARLLHEIGMW